MVYVIRILYNDVDGNDDGDIKMSMSYWGNCPICKGPLEEVYYGGGKTKHECRNCVKHFVTSIYNDPEN